MKGTAESTATDERSMDNPRAWIERAMSGQIPLTPAGTLLGLRITGIEDGVAHLEWPLDGRVLNGVGVVQGGMMASFADSCMAYAVMTALRERASVAGCELKINFLHPVRSGTLRGEGRVIRRGKRMLYVEATITDEDDNLVARASSTFMVW